MRAEVPPTATNVEESRRNLAVAFAVHFAVADAVAFAVAIATVTGPVAGRGHPEHDPDRVRVQPLNTGRLLFDA